MVCITLCHNITFISFVKIEFRAHLLHWIVQVYLKVNFVVASIHLVIDVILRVLLLFLVDIITEA